MGSLTMFQIVATIFVLADFVSLGFAAFNCTRPGSRCQNGGMCDVANGGCICMGTTFTGYDCSQERQHIMHGACLSHDPCLNGGTCYEMAVAGSPGTALCYCPYEFYGAYCQLPRVQSECYGDQMIVNVNPGPNFFGVVNIQHKTGICPMSPVNSQVEFTLDPVRSKWEGFAAVLPFKGSVCGAGPTMNTTATEIIYTYDVLIRYDTAGTKPELDEIISFSCPTPNLAAGPIGPTAVLFSVADAHGAMVDRPKLGSPVTITFNVDPTSIFTDILVQNCSVSNSQKTKSKPVVEQSCAVKPFGKSLVKQGPKHVLTMIVHTFGADPNLTFDCSVKVCTVSDTSCQKPPVCPVNAPPLGTGPHPVDPHGHAANPHGPPVDPHGIPVDPHAHPVDPHAHPVDPHGHPINPHAQVVDPHVHPPIDPNAHAHSASHGDILGLLGSGGGALASLLTGGPGGSMAVQDLMNSLGPGPGTNMASGPGGATSNMLNDLMAMGGGGAAIGSNVMNDLLFSGGHGSQGPSYGSPGIFSGPMGMGRRRRDVSTVFDDAASSQFVVVSGALCKCKIH